MVADGGDWATWSDVHPFNEEGNIDFVRRDVARVKEDQEHVGSFFFWLVTFGLSAAFMAALPLPDYFLLALLPVLAVPCLFVLTHLRPVSRWVESTAAAYLGRQEDSDEVLQTVYANGNNSVAAGRVFGEIHVHPRPAAGDDGSREGRPFE